MNVIIVSSVYSVALATRFSPWSSFNDQFLIQMNYKGHIYFLKNLSKFKSHGNIAFWCIYYHKYYCCLLSLYYIILLFDLRENIFSTFNPKLTVLFIKLLFIYFFCINIVYCACMSLSHVKKLSYIYNSSNSKIL